MNTIPANDSWTRWNKIAQKAQHDAAFKNRLLSDLETVVNEHGLEIPAGYQIALEEKPDQELELIVRKKVPTGELSEEDLTAVVGGGTKDYDEIRVKTKSSETIVIYPGTGKQTTVVVPEGSTTTQTTSTGGGGWGW
jgi:hypothetical protein